MKKFLSYTTLAMIITLNLAACDVQPLKAKVEENNISGHYIEGVLCHDKQQEKEEVQPINE